METFFLFKLASLAVKGASKAVTQPIVEEPGNYKPRSYKPACVKNKMRFALDPNVAKRRKTWLWEPTFSN